MMPAYESVRDRIVAIVSGVSGIGRVFPHLRYSSDLETFVNLFTVPHPADPTKKIPSVAFVTRQSAIESASWSEDIVNLGVTAQETYRITMLYGFQDDDDVENASDSYFQVLVDRVLEAFRFADPATFANGVATINMLRVYPAQLLNAGVFTQELGGYMCHKAEIDIRVEMYING